MSNQSLRKKYKSAYSLLTEIINTIDPIGLMAFGAPEDEYDIEISKILPAIANDNDLESIEEKILNIFIQYFGKEDIGERGNYRKIAERIIELKKEGKLP